MKEALKDKFLLSVLVAGIVIRFLLPLFISDNPTKGDGADNLRYAVNLAEHGVYSGDISDPPQPGFSRMPGTPWLLRIAMIWSSPGEYMMLIPNILCGIGILILVLWMLVVFEWHSGIGRILFGIFCLVPAVDFYASQYYPEVPAVFFTLLSFAFLFSFLKSKKALHFFLAGCATAAAALFRPELLFNSVFLLGAIWFVKTDRRLIFGGMFIGGMVLILSPWMVRNLIQSGSPHVLGENFFIEDRVSGDSLDRGCANGLYKWINTWHFRESHVKQVAWDFRAANLDDLPRYAFANEEEKKYLLELQQQPEYTCAIDDSLAALAARRVNDKTFKIKVLLPVMRMWFLMARDTRSDSLRVIGLPPFLVELTFWVFAIVISLVNLLGLSMWRVFTQLSPILKIMLIAGTARLIFFAFFYHVEHRYMMLWYPEFFLLTVLFLRILLRNKYTNDNFGSTTES